MGLNIGLYLRRSEGPIRKSEVLVRKSEVLVWTSDQEETKGICLCKQETHVEDSPIALIIHHQFPFRDACKSLLITSQPCLAGGGYRASPC